MTVISRKFSAPSFCEKEILRYAGCKEAGSEVLRLMNECIEESKGIFSYRVCYCKVPVFIKENRVSLGAVSFVSSDLAKNLNGCIEAVLFAATVGIELDRLIGKYSRFFPSKAVFFDAIGAERIESLCDLFCFEMKASEGKDLTPRFSPGYGDFPLEAQKEIFSLLQCEKKIGLVLNDSLLMSPSKSVTAIFGLK